MEKLLNIIFYQILWLGGFVAIFGLYRKLGQKINPIVDIFLPLVLYLAWPIVCYNLFFN